MPKCKLCNYVLIKVSDYTFKCKECENYCRSSKEKDWEQVQFNGWRYLFDYKYERIVLDNILDTYTSVFSKEFPLVKLTKNNINHFLNRLKNMQTFS
jgi:hypothetical protein